MGKNVNFMTLFCINYHKYANEWIFQKIEITIAFYTLHLTCMQIFAAIGSETAEILGGGGGGVKLTPPPPSKNLVWNSPVKIGLKIK